jgi:hypothetical protein
VPAVHTECADKFILGILGPSIFAVFVYGIIIATKMMETLSGKQKRFVLWLNFLLLNVLRMPCVSWS